MKKKNELKKWNYYVIGGIALFALIAVFSTGVKAETSLIQSFIDKAGDTFGRLWFDKVSETVDVGELESFGRSNFITDCYSNNGVEYCYYNTGMNKASTTVCSIKSPSATSTLMFASLTLTTGTSTTPMFEIGKSYQYDATTTSFGTWTLAASQLGTMVASTTYSGMGSVVDPQTVFSPNTYLNFKYGGVLGTTNVFVGKCKAEFIKNY